MSMAAGAGFKTPTFRLQSSAATGTTATPHASPLATPGLFTPAQLRKAYGADAASFTSTAGATVTGDGTGQTIALIDAYNAPTITTDLAASDKLYGLVAPTLTVVNQTGGTTLPASAPKSADGSWAEETSLDVEWAHAMAPGASLLLVEATTDSDANLYAAVDYARKTAGVSVVSMSFGDDEQSTDSANDAHIVTPTGHAGVTFVASSGDNGAYSDTSASTRVVGYPAVSPNVVGGGCGVSKYFAVATDASAASTDRKRQSSHAGLSRA